MTDTATEKFPGIDQIEAFYIIHSADTTRDGEDTLEHMARRVAPFLAPDAESEFGLELTEGDEQYEYAYLGEGRDGEWCSMCGGDGGSSPWESQTGYWRYSVEMGGIGPITACEMCGGTGLEESSYQHGHHRKWAGLLPGDRYEEFMEAYLIDLDDDGLPTNYCETMGSMTGYGILPAISVDDAEGWGSAWTGPNGGVIDSNIYISYMLKEKS